MSDAEKCRTNGWTVGTMLEGDEGYGVTQIRITAIGEDHILAREISHDDKPTASPYDRESHWTLTCREWREASS